MWGAIKSLFGRFFKPKSYNKLTSVKIQPQQIKPVKQPVKQEKTTDQITKNDLLKSALISSLSRGGVSRPKVMPAETQYLEHIASQPSTAELQKKYSEQLGLEQTRKEYEKLRDSIADIESKILRVEPEVTKRIKGFLVTEGARKRLVGAEEKPLRRRYAELSIQAGKVGAELAEKQRQLSQLVQAEKEAYRQKGAYLRALGSYQRKLSRGALGSSNALASYLIAKLSQPETKTVSAPRSLIGLPLGLKEPKLKAGSARLRTLDSLANKYGL